MALARAPSPRSPARQALHEAITFRDECAGKIERLKDAQSKVVPWRINAELERGRERLAKLEKEAERHAFDSAVGDVTTMPPPVEQVRAEIALAERDLATAEKVRRQIDNELRGLESMQQFRVAGVVAKAKAVLADELPRSKALAEVLADLQSTRLRFLRLARVAHWLADVGAIEKNGIAESLRRSPSEWPEQVADDERWEAALDALTGDADAVLPP